jgi:hypothetical protein
MTRLDEEIERRLVDAAAYAAATAGSIEDAERVFGSSAIGINIRPHNAHARARAELVGLRARSVQSLRFHPRGSQIDQVDPHSARVARERYGCLTPWQSDPATYGHAALTGAYPTCESDIVRVLTDLLHKRRDYAERDGERFMDAVQNARLITNAERYYRIMFYGSRASWNLRDSHMFETLKTLLAFYGPKSKAIMGRTILTSEMPPPPRCSLGANTIWGIFAAGNSVTAPMPSASAHTPAPLQQR